MSASAIDEIIGFWFGKLTPGDWWRKDSSIDTEISGRFGGVYDRLKAGIPPGWLSTPKGWLAAILVLDQFPRNMFRGDARAFATDAQALSLANQAIAGGIDAKLPPEQRAFIYLPFQHSEDAADQARSIELFTALGQPLNLDFAIRHKEIIDRFGRFPHRNESLGRKPTAEEIAFLQEPGSSF
jgi:uncharacterized protein (DUF924 family)